MPTKSGAATLADLKPGVSLFHVFSMPAASGVRRVSHRVERYVVVRLEHMKSSSGVDVRVHFKQADSWAFHKDAGPADMVLSNLYAAVMGIQPKGRVWMRDVGHKCFLSYARAETYRKRQIATQQTRRETSDAIYMDKLMWRSMNQAARVIAPLNTYAKVVDTYLKGSPVDAN